MSKKIVEVKLYRIFEFIKLFYCLNLYGYRVEFINIKYRIPALVSILTFFIFSNLSSQTFRLERPVPDNIQSHGNYLYGEPWFWAEGGAHRGLDIWVINDTVYSASDGVVEFAAYDPDNEDGYEPGGFGNYLRIRSTWNNKKLYIYYAHLIKPLVNTGNNIFPGQPIAISGTTGNSTGPHLHFEIRQNEWYGTRRNPELWFSMEGTGAIYGRVPNAEDNMRVNISPDPKPRPPYTTFSFALTYGFFDGTIGSDDVYNENYAIGDVRPGTYTITALNGDYIRTVTVNAGEIVNADDVTDTADDYTPLSFELFQNYPNPFNPSTTITFTITEASHTTLTVYNSLGQRVETIVNEYISAGRYSKIFDTSNRNLSTGIYIYTLVSGSGIINNKMILIK